MTAQAHSHTHAAWRHGEASRAAALASIDTHIDNVKACVRYLIAQGVYVQDVKVFSHGYSRPRITVAASPLLHAIFKDDCAAGQHWDALLGRTVHDYKAVRFECSVIWSEVKP